MFETAPKPMEEANKRGVQPQRHDHEEDDSPKSQLELHRALPFFSFCFRSGYFIAAMRNPINATQHQCPHRDKVRNPLHHPARIFRHRCFADFADAG